MASKKEKKYHYPPNKVEDFLSWFFKWIVLAVVIIILVAGYFLVLKKQYSQIVKSRDKDLAEVIDKIKEMRLTSDSMFQYFDQSIDFKPSEEYLLSLALPDKFDFPSIAIQLSALAKEHDMLLQSIEINIPRKRKKNQKRESNSRLKKVNLSLSIGGNTYEKFKEFLSAIENSVMVFDVMSIRFVSRGHAGQGYEVELIAYYYEK